MYMEINLLFLLIIITSFFVILSNNPVQSMLSLILVFILVIFIFIILGAEFLALLTLIIYVGAISILFLFVIMLLNLRIVEIYSNIYYFLPIGAFLGILFIFELIFVIFDNLYLPIYLQNYFIIDWFQFLNLNSNLYLLGDLLYNHNSDLFILGGLILFIAMIGSISLVSNFVINNHNRN